MFWVFGDFGWVVGHRITVTRIDSKFPNKLGNVFMANGRRRPSLSQARQGPLNRGGVPDLDLSFFVLLLSFFGPLLSFLGTFPMFLDVPDLSGDGPRIFLICPFPLSRPIRSTYEEQSRKGPQPNPDLSRKSGKPPGLETPRFFRDEKSAQRGSFGTDIPRTSGGHSRGYPGQKLRSGRSKAWKNKHFGADIHDPKARTSTTLRDFQKLRSEKLWAEISFPRFSFSQAKNPGEKRHMNINFLIWLTSRWPWDKRLVVPG